MKLINNTIYKKNSQVEKKFLEKAGYKREIYFYKTFKNKNLNIPEIINKKKNIIFFKKYKFKK